MDVTTTSTKIGKFDARFFDLVFEEEFGRVKGHFGPINSLAFHPNGEGLVFSSCSIRSLLSMQIGFCLLAGTAVVARMATFVFTCLIQITKTSPSNISILCKKNSFLLMFYSIKQTKHRFLNKTMSLLLLVVFLGKAHVPQELGIDLK